MYRKKILTNSNPKKNPVPILQSKGGRACLEWRNKKCKNGRKYRNKKVM
jgi:hypothetical protein